jgi:hypothetical protein
MKKLTTQDFIERARKIHGDKYDYSKVDYINAQTKVCIICPQHGEFWQTPNDHLNGHGCKECMRYSNSQRLAFTLTDFINKSKEVHGNKYDYSKVSYINNKTKVCIICPIHGEFWQTPNGHINGNGCPICGKESSINSKKHTKNTFLEKAIGIHGLKYDYSKMVYKSSKTKICIICPVHGEFWQRPTNHLEGQGCPLCKESNLEKEIAKYLYENKIKYERGFKDKWLGKQHLDFYLPKYNIGIECQGIQHFEPKSFGSHEDAMLRFKVDIKRDKLKMQKCKENGIKLIYYNPFEKYFGTYENEIHNTEDLKKVLVNC